MIANFIMLVLSFLLLTMWWVKKSSYSLIAFWQLFFLFTTILPIILFSFTKGIKLITKFFGSNFALAKFGIFCVVTLWGYNATTGFNEILPRMNIGTTVSTGLIEFFTIGVPIVGVFLLLYFVHLVEDTRSNNKNILLFLLLFLFLLFCGALWSDSNISYDQNIKSLAFFPHFYYHCFFFILLPLFIFLRNANIKTIGFSFDLNIRDLVCFAIGSFVIIFVHYTIRTWVDEFHIPDISILKWVFKITYIMFIIALPEELLMRGIGISVIEQRLINKPKKTTIAVVITSVLFGLAHYKLNPFVVIFSILFGFVYAFLFVRTRKLIAPILAHTLVDVLFAPYPF